LTLIKRYAAVAVLGAGLTACTSGQSAVEPTVTQANIASSSTLQFAVGTANLSSGAATGLNTVVTFRQANGLDATLFNLPTITGPAGFLNNGPVAITGSDSGTNKISSPTTLPLVGVAATQTTFVSGNPGVASGGAFSYGFAPENSTTSGAASFGAYNEPFFQGKQAIAVGAPPTALTEQPFLGGPPAFPFVRDGTFPTGFNGYPSGLVAFDQTVVAAGAYALNVVIPSANSATTTLTATANLTSVAVLPAIAAPVVSLGAPTLPPAAAPPCTRAGANGISFTAVIPAGVTEAIAYVEQGTVAGATASVPGRVTASSFYTIVTHATGPVTFTVPDNLGPHSFGLAAAPSFNAGATVGTGDEAVVTIVGFDYPAFEAAPPLNTSATPTIVGANGQADITVSTQGLCRF